MSSKRARPDPVAEEEAADLDLYAGRLGFAGASFKNEFRSAWHQSSDTPSAGLRNETVDDGVNAGLDEEAGVGVISETLKTDSDINNFLHQKSRPVNEKLLEQLLGSKGARSKKKEMDAAKVSAASQPLPSKKSDASAKQQEDSSDDEGGRASAITSKRGGRSHLAPIRKAAVDDGGEEDDDALSTSRPPPGADRKADDVDQADTRPIVTSKSMKRKATGGYLDELLAAKASKKNRKNKSGDTNANDR
jgi:hypothetical protein